MSHIRVGGNVQAAHLTHCVEPIYPDLARQALISGTVHFSVTIDPGGNVTDLVLISGHPLLVYAAKEAVSQYTYEPTLSNGRQVAVISTIAVLFDLNGRSSCPAIQ